MTDLDPDEDSTDPTDDWSAGEDDDGTVVDQFLQAVDVESAEDGEVEIAISIVTDDLMPDDEPSEDDGAEAVDDQSDILDEPDVVGPEIDDDGWDMGEALTASAGGMGLPVPGTGVSGLAGRSMPSTWTAVAVGLLAAAGAAAMASSRPRPDGVEGSDTSDPDGSGDPVADRAQLRDVAVESTMSLSSDALRCRLIAQLSEIGVVIDEPEPGTPFDPSRHQAVERTETDDPDRHLCIDAVFEPGLIDHGEVVRPATVRVLVHSEVTDVAPSAQQDR